MSIRILHIASGDFHSSYGGGQVYVRNVVDEMIRQHIEVGILSSINHRTSVEKKSYREIPLYELSPISNEDDLISVIRDFNPTLIHAHSRKAEISTIAQDINIPIVITAHHGGIVCPGGALMAIDDHICHNPVSHNNCLHCELINIRTGKFWYPVMKHLPEHSYLKLGEFLSKHKFLPFITPIGSSAVYIRNHIDQWNTICKNAGLVIAPCKALAESMILNGLDKTKVKIIPHGIPLPAYKTRPAKIVNGTIKFFYVGRISYIKGLHILLEAFHSLDVPNIELHLIGEAVTKDELRYFARMHRKYQNDIRIKWHGKVKPERMNEMIRDYHVSVAPSICLEAFGLNISEALAAGKPVLTSRNGGGEDQIKDGINGWVVPQNDSTALKSKMEEILSNPERINIMSGNCNAVSIESHVNELLNIYQELL